VDQQGAAIPGASITAKNPATGLSRTEVSDAEGVYRLSALPVGIYEVVAELTGFATVSKQDVEVNVGQTVASTSPEGGDDRRDRHGHRRDAAHRDDVLVGRRRREHARIETIPLNGRQFANLAATIPGVGLGFHTDPTKSTQYSPQINGGNGRNVNYQIDGGDNNDDTVGGLLQLFPLEAIQEFNFQTQRFKAEYGRSNGGVLNVVTKSGTNQWSAAGSSSIATRA
jgi:hypothetical protein